ncbi:hypothetical protein L7F22_043419 [Adiantum nelumboides]|nr:hypothetical protein [Adiantum nelumboides]
MFVFFVIHPQTDGQSEETNSIVLDLLKCYVSKNKAKWEQYLPLVEYAYNNTLHSSTGKAPFEIVEGGKKVPSILHTKDLKIFEADKYVQDMDEMYKKARLKTMKGKERLFPKLSMRYYGPFQVCDKISDVAYKLKLPENWKIHNAFHVSLLRPYVGDVPEDMPVEEQQEVEELDKILVLEQILAPKERKVKGKRLLDIGVPEAIRWGIYALYESVTGRVRAAGGLSNAIESTIGVKQGCPLSPTLFGIYIDELSKYVDTYGDAGSSLVGVMIPLLLYADDVVLISDSPEGLQRQLDALQRFCADRDLTVNLGKTKVMVFNTTQAWVTRAEHQFTFRGEMVEQDADSPNSIVGHIQDADSPKDAWDNLIAFNATNARARKIQLKNGLNTIKKRDLSMNEYTLKIIALCESLFSIGVAMDDMEAFLCGLGNAYK